MSSPPTAQQSSPPDRQRVKGSAKRTAKTLYQVALETWTRADNDRVMRLAAALAFYTALSLAPLILVLQAVAEMFWSAEGSRRALLRFVREMAGSNGVETARNILETNQGSSSSGWAATVGLVMLLVGATTVFASLQDSLNTIWGVKANPKSEIWGWIKKRLVSAVIVLLIGLLLGASLLLSSVLSAMSSYLGGLPGSETLWRVGSIALGLGVYTLLFGLMYHHLPDVKIRWSDVWIGALATAVLFTVGKELISLYLGVASIGSRYGAAGSFMLLLVFIYYSALCVFVGAEFTQVYARRWGEEIEPSLHAVRIPRREI